MFTSLKNYIYILGVIYALIAVAAFPRWTVDDAYIIYRYAENFANHGELNWNVGEDPVEGYTGLVLPVVLAFFIKLGVSPVFVGKVMGIVFYFLAGFLLYLIFRKLNLNDIASSISLILYFTAPFYFSHVWSGLETMLFMSLLLVCIYVLLNIVATDRQQMGSEIVLPLMLLLASLVRPEGVVLAGTTFVALAWIKRKYHQDAFGKFVLRFCALYVVPGLIYFLWRWHYYGQLLPNTFYVKSDPGFISKSSVLRLILFVLISMSLPTIACILSCLSDRKSVGKWLSDRYSTRGKQQVFVAFLSIAAYVVLVILQYLRSRLLMNFEFRFFVPYLPVYLLFLTIFLSAGFSVLREMKASRPALYRILSWLVSLLVVIQLAVNVNLLREYRFLRAGYKAMIEQEHIPAGQFLRENLRPSEWLIVVHDAGAIPYYAQLRTADFSRLNNEDLIRKRLSEDEVADYFFSLNAGAVVITSYNWDKVYQPWIFGSEAERIVEDPRFERYVLVKKYKTDVPPDNPSSGYFEFLFMRKDLIGSPNVPSFDDAGR